MDPLKGLGFGTPLGALGGAVVIGQDEVGNPIYQDALGRSYSVGPQPQRSRELERLLGLPDDPQTPAGFNPMALLSGFTAPGNALRGQMMTVGDVWDTAGTASLGGAAMPAPANALRMGAMRSVDDVAERGSQIMDMLKAGRGSDVTDAMLDMGDPVKNARLNEWLYANYDLPMDAGSRAARAGEMGMSSDVYRGMGPSPYDMTNATPDPLTLRVSEWGKFGQAVSTSPNPEIAGGYAANGAVSRLAIDAGDFGTPEQYAAARGSATGGRFVGAGPESRMATDEMRQRGFSGVASPEEVAVYDPSNIRSRFARFDPRLAHLRNLSAGVAGAATVGAASQEEINAYLRSIGAL